MSAGMATTRRTRHDMTTTNSVAGGNVRIRRPTVDDVSSVVRFVGWLGRESIQQRFFSVRTNWSPLDTHDGRVRIPSEQSVAVLAWLSTPGIQLALLCSLLLILGVAALAGAENPASPSDASWASDIRRVDEALARGDRSGAEWVWHDAYAKALAAREWEGMLAVGDAYLRIADVAHGRKVGEMTARTLYLAALYRARQEGVLHGVLEAAERFLQLGDREMVTQCLVIADRLAVGSQEPGEQADVEIFRARWNTRSLLGPRPAWETPTLWLFPNASVGP